MESGKLGLITFLLGKLLRELAPELITKAIDSVLDIAEDAISQSPSKLDDATILPLIKMIREGLDIPDDDDFGRA